MHEQLVIQRPLQGLTSYTLDTMRVFALRGSREPRIRELARRIVRNVRSRDYRGELSAIGSWVRKNVRYTRDPKGMETLQTPGVTIDSAAGDCDDMSILSAALLGAVGHKTRFSVIGRNVGDHVFTEAFVGGQWIPVDPSAPTGLKVPPDGYRTFFRSESPMNGYNDLGFDGPELVPSREQISNRHAIRNRERFRRRDFTLRENRIRVKPTSGKKKLDDVMRSISRQTGRPVAITAHRPGRTSGRIKSVTPIAALSESAVACWKCYNTPDGDMMIVPVSHSDVSGLGDLDMFSDAELDGIASWITSTFSKAKSKIVGWFKPKAASSLKAAQKAAKYSTKKTTVAAKSRLSTLTQKIGGAAQPPTSIGADPGMMTSIFGTQENAGPAASYETTDLWQGDPGPGEGPDSVLPGSTVQRQGQQQEDEKSSFFSTPLGFAAIGGGAFLAAKALKLF